MAQAEVRPPLSRDDLVALQPPIPRTLEHLDRAVRMTFVNAAPGADPSLDPSRILAESVRFLEQRRAIAGIAEALHRSNVHTLAEFESRSSEVILLARRLTRIDPIEILARDASFVDAARDAGQRSQAELPVEFLQGIVRAMRSLLAFCPIDHLVTLGERAGQPELGHRCRLSYDWLAAFVRRHTSDISQTRDIVGQAYADGRLGVDEASSLLMMPIPDAVAWLERHGWARDIELLKLDGAERTRSLADVRRDRLADTRTPGEGLVERDVIATQRIEDVDARPWVAVP